MAKKGSAKKTLRGFTGANKAKTVKTKLLKGGKGKATRGDRYGLSI